MSAPDRYIAGVPCWLDIAPADPEAAVAFYRDLFGWTFEDVMPAEAPGRYFVARLPGGDVAAVGEPPEGGTEGAQWNTYIWVEDADATAGKVRDAGGTVVAEPADVGDAGRMAVCADPAGAAFCLWQAGNHRGSAVVNEHGSVNFNDLHTNDLAGAEAFYRAVFGWELLYDSMWALPGYGDFLEARRPGMRAGMAEMGAPERFEDVVASASLLRDDRPGARPHWGVTFAVDDADAIAARAAELGGEVLAGPLDAPWVRMTVIRDPQGAEFTASMFVPANKDLPMPAGV